MYRVKIITIVLCNRLGRSIFGWYYNIQVSTRMMDNHWIQVQSKITSLIGWFQSNDQNSSRVGKKLVCEKLSVWEVEYSTMLLLISHLGQGCSKENSHQKMYTWNCCHNIILYQQIRTKMTAGRKQQTETRQLDNQLVKRHSEVKNKLKWGEVMEVDKSSCKAHIHRMEAFMA